MPRITPIDPATATGRAKELFDGPLSGKHFNVFKSLAAAPAALDAYLAMSGALAKGVLTAKEREAVALAIGQANACEYCSAAHAAIAKGAGMSESDILGARRGTLADGRLDALVKFTLRLHEKRGSVSDADVNAFRAAGFTDAHIVEVVANYAINVFTNYFNHLNMTPVDFPPVTRI